jgi:hypothetical protein
MAEQTKHLWRNADWKIEPKPDGTFAPDDMTNALLVDIRGLLRKMKSFLVFFTVWTVISMGFSLAFFLYSYLK